MESSPSVTTLEQQLDNLANMTERVATPEFQQGFRASVAARAKAAKSFLIYRNEQGQLVREWPDSGRTEAVK